MTESWREVGLSMNLIKYLSEKQPLRCGIISHFPYNSGANPYFLTLEIGAKHLEQLDESWLKGQRLVILVCRDVFPGDRCLFPFLWNQYAFFDVSQANHLRLVVYRIICVVFYVPGGAGFLPSTVVMQYLHRFLYQTRFCCLASLPVGLRHPKKWDQKP